MDKSHFPSRFCGQAGTMAPGARRLHGPCHCFGVGQGVSRCKVDGNYGALDQTALGCVLALDKCVQMWTRNYGALGQTTSCEKCWIQVSPVPASDEVCPHVFFDLVAVRCVPSSEKCWMQVSPVPASDEMCPPVCASYEMCSCVSSTNLKCIMTFLLRERKDVMLEVAKELRVEIDITLPKMEFKKRICQSKYYDEETVKCLFEGILVEKRE
ncbi:hypothetical protein TNCV_4816871 [Trichonephila clavipes]|nr:hypothetical protein TNCV_4816871 [Trichonephila clavipes]